MRRCVLTLLLATAITSAAVSCGGDDEGGGATDATEQAITIAWGAEPPSLDPGRATDTTSSNVLLAIMDPLVKLNPETTEAEPALAESWDVSEDGTVVTYHWTIDLERGAYELDVFGYFESSDGATGDFSGALGLLVGGGQKKYDALGVTGIKRAMQVCPFAG